MSEEWKGAPFSQQFAYLNRGVHDVTMTEALNKVVEAVQKHGGKGEITLKVGIRPFKKTNRMIISAAITTKLPKGDLPEDILFVDEQGRLLRHDPQQHQLPLRQVEGPGEPRQLDDEAEVKP